MIVLRDGYWRGGEGIVTRFRIQTQYSPEGKCTICPPRETFPIGDIRTWNLASAIGTHYIFVIHVGMPIAMLVA